MRMKAILIIVLVIAVFAFLTAAQGGEKTKKKPGSGKVSVKATSPQGTPNQGPPAAGTPPPPPFRKPGKTKPTGSLTDLRVDLVWLDGQCRINFRLRNAGKNTMPDKEHERGMVRVYWGEDYEDFYLTKRTVKKKPPVGPSQNFKRPGRFLSYNPAVDPNEALKRPGRILSYNTKIELKERLRVKAYVGYLGRIARADKRKGKSLTLVPQCAAALASAKTSSERVNPGPKATATIQRAMEASEKTDPQAGMKVSKEPPEGIKSDIKNVTTKGGGCDWGIVITSPAAGDVCPFSRPIHVHFEQIESLGPGGPRLHPVLKSDTGDYSLGFPSIESPGIGEGDFDLEIPSTVRPGNYVVYLGTSPGGRGTIHGCSDVFRIGGATDAGGDLVGYYEVNVTTPSSGQVWPRGHIKEIRWRTIPNFGSAFPGTWTIGFMKDGRPVYDWYPGVTAATSYDDASGEYVLSHRLLPDLPYGTGFRVWVRMRIPEGRVTGLSGTFTIPEKSIYVNYPDGRSLCRTSSQLIRWSTVGEFTEGVDIHLVRHGGIGSKLFSNLRADTEFVNWRVPALSFRHVGEMPGYQVRVTSCADPSIYGESLVFSLQSPEISVTNPVGGDSLSLGDDVNIEWTGFCHSGQVYIDLIQGGGSLRGSSKKRIATVNSSDRSYSWRAGIIERRGEYYRGAWGTPDNGAPVERESITGDNLKIRVTSEYSDMLYGESYPFDISR